LGVKDVNAEYPGVLTELAAATAYATAWNRLDCAEFLKLLASDAHFTSQWVSDELVSKPAIADRLKEKMFGAKNSGTKIFAELGRTSAELAGRDCVFMAHGRKENVTATVLFKVGSLYIKRYDVFMPELLMAVRSGVYPI